MSDDLSYEKELGLMIEIDINLLKALFGNSLPIIEIIAKLGYAGIWPILTIPS